MDRFDPSSASGVNKAAIDTSKYLEIAFQFCDFTAKISLDISVFRSANTGSSVLADL